MELAPDPANELSEEQSPYRQYAPFWQCAGRCSLVSGITASCRELRYNGGSDLREWAMLWTIFVILLVLWLLGVVSSYTLGGFVHVLLVVAIVVALIQLLQGRRAL